MYVLQADASAVLARSVKRTAQLRKPLLRDAAAVIADGNLDVLPGIDAGQADCSRIAEGVRNGVFDNRLKRQLGNQRIGILLWNVDPERLNHAELLFLQEHIVSCNRQLVAQRGNLVRGADAVAQNLAERADHLDGRLIPVDLRHHADRFQRVIQEMRADLNL